MKKFKILFVLFILICLKLDIYAGANANGWHCETKEVNVYLNELAMYGIDANYDKKEKEIVISQNTSFPDLDFLTQGTDPIVFNVEVSIIDGKYPDETKIKSYTLKDIANDGQTTQVSFKIADVCESKTTCYVSTVFTLDNSSDHTLLNRGANTRKTCWESYLEYAKDKNIIKNDILPGDKLLNGSTSTYKYSVEFVWEGGIESEVINTNKATDSNPSISNPDYDNICAQFRGEANLDKTFKSKLCGDNDANKICDKDYGFINIDDNKNYKLTDKLNGNGENKEYYKGIIGSYCYSKNVTALKVYKDKDTLYDILATAIKTLYVKNYVGDPSDKTIADEDGDGKKTVNEVFNEWKEYANQSNNSKIGLVNEEENDSMICHYDLNKYRNYKSENSGESYVWNSGTGNWLTKSKDKNATDFFTKKVSDDGQDFLNVEYYYKETSFSKKATFNYNLATNNKDLKVSSTENICDITCGEAVKVAYYPPQIVKAGMCFQYKVKVVSYVKCSTSFNDQIKVITGEDCTGDNCEDGKPTSLYNKYVSPYPTCVHSGGIIYAAAGPSEDYEDCVKKCDNGKYTESCSQKCYKKVYGNTNSKLSSNSSTSSVTMLADNDFNETSKKNNSSVITDSKLKNYNDLVSCLELNPEGCYYYYNGEYQWFATKEGWNAVDDYGYKYILTNLIKTDSRNALFALIDLKYMGRYYADANYKAVYSSYYTSDGKTNYPCNGSKCAITTTRLANESDLETKYLNARRVFSSDRLSDSGFRKAYYFKYSGKTGVRGAAYNKCGADCSWEEPNALSQKSAYLNPYVYQIDLKNNVKNYAEKVYECIAAATCRTSTAEFTISTKYNDKDNVTQTISYPYSQLKKTSSSSSTSSSKSSDSSCSSTKDFLCSTNENNENDKCKTNTNSPAILQYSSILSYGGCYYYGNGANNNDDIVDDSAKINSRYYKAEIGFPGVWESLKGGSYKYGCEPVGSYDFVSNSFCVDSKNKPVNLSYYNDFINHKVNEKSNEECPSCLDNSDIGENSTVEKAKSSYNKKDSADGWNIKATVKNFGYFNWNFSIYCFYSTSKGYDIITSDETEKSTTNNSNTSDSCNDCPKVEKSALSLRAADNNNLFTSEEIATGDNSSSETSNKNSISTTKGFNWSLAATNGEKATGTYTINPEKIIEYIETTEKSGKTYSEENSDYIIEISTVGIQKLKEYIKNNNGDYTSGFTFIAKDSGGYGIENVDGILTYKSKILGNASDYGIKVTKSTTGTNTSHVKN